MTTALRRIGHSAAPLAWATGASLAARIPTLAEAFPVLGLLRGPLGVGLVASGLAMALARHVSWRPRALPSRALFAIAAVLYLTVGLFYAQRLQAAGDEPHYLIMAQSLWQEGDLDLRSNYFNRDYLAYNPGPVEPHYGAPRRDGRPFPAHSPGLPALLAPIYAMGGRRACIVLLALIAALVTQEVYRAALAVTRDGEAALLAWAAALGPPVLFYSFHVYTELPAALVILLSLRLVRSASTATRGVMLAGLIGVLPWLHVKMIPVALVLGIFSVAQLRRPALPAFAATALVMAVAYLGYYQLIFGRPTPLAIYGGVPRDLDGRPVAALLGLLLDRSFGLLPHAPIYLLALAGLPLLLRERRFVSLAVALAVVAPLLGWRMWWGGMCPPARFLTPIVPVLAVVAAQRVAGSRRGLAHWRWPLVAVGLALGAYMVHNPVDRLLLNQRGNPTRVWSWLAGDADLGRYLPSLVSASPEDLKLAGIWAVLLAGLLSLDVLARRHDQIDRLFRSFGFALALLFAVGVATDTWVRSERAASAAVGAGPRRPASERPAAASGTGREWHRTARPG